MDIIRFTNPTAPLKMEQGVIVNDLKTKTWIERYRNSGEFTLVANADTGMRERLPIGSFITHMDTTELMIVENHEISDVEGQETEITITGSGFETILAQRIVGANGSFPFVGAIPDYVVPGDYIWNQIVALVNNHIKAGSLVDPQDELPYVEIFSNLLDSLPTAEGRAIQRGSLYDRMLELMQLDDLGIKVIRPGAWSPLADPANTALVIHVGQDRTKEVVFSYDTGEIVSADYLWSNKKLKNSALVSGRWVQIRIDSSTDVKGSRRMMYVDASDLDQSFTAEPAGTDLTDVEARMAQRGQAALAAQNEIALTKAEVSKESTRAQFRIDFEVGDLVTVSGDYNERSTMRVSEFVEIEDENGLTAYPTLTLAQGV